MYILIFILFFLKVHSQQIQNNSNNIPNNILSSTKKSKVRNLNEDDDNEENEKEENEKDKTENEK